MTQARAQTPHLTACVVLEKNQMLKGEALERRINEGLAVLTKAMDAFIDSSRLDISYDVEVSVQEDAIVIRGQVKPIPLPMLQMNLSVEEMQALFEIDTTCIK